SSIYSLALIVGVGITMMSIFFFFSSRRRHTRSKRDWSSDVCSSDLFDARYAWPVYDWMGVAKAAFEATNRYLARDLGPAGIRCNLVSAGPIRTTAAKSIPGFGEMEGAWPDRAPLGWDVDNPEPTARAVAALLSDWFPATTGEIIHVDGGVHAMGQ